MIQDISEGKETPYQILLDIGYLLVSDPAEKQEIVLSSADKMLYQEKNRRAE